MKCPSCKTTTPDFVCDQCEVATDLTRMDRVCVFGPVFLICSLFAVGCGWTFVKFILGA